MGWSELQSRQQAAVYAALGHDATWQGVSGTVRVIIRDEDRMLGQTVADAVELRVRKSEVEAPETGEAVTIVDGRTYEIIGTPLLDRKLNWRCEAAPTN